MTIPKSDDAPSKVISTNEDFTQSGLKYMADVENFRIHTISMVTKNNKRIADLKVEIKGEKEQIKADFQKHIENLEKKNSQLELRLDQYNKDIEYNWEAFKTVFNNDMEDLEDALNELVAKID
jgi:predicted  nucleic acid-binding Zn-ribbon protein